jgi:hypothetical protein
MPEIFILEISKICQMRHTAARKVLRLHSSTSFTGTGAVAYEYTRRKKQDL